ncbi:MAG: type II secretion system protein, partial [Streptosporangiaceae bacterium]
MTEAFIIGALGGVGLFVFVFALIPRRTTLAKQVAAFDAARPLSSRASYSMTRGQESELSRRLGKALAAFCAEQGWEFPSLRANLSLVGKSFENFLATKLLLAVFGLLFAPILLVILTFSGLHV